MEVILLNIKKHWLPIVVVILVVVIFLLVTFARANEGLDICHFSYNNYHFVPLLFLYNREKSGQR